MADKNVNTVTAATAVAAGDSLLVSKSNTALQKIDYNLLAKAIIEQYTDSTLAGSAQSLKSALDALNSKLFVQAGGNITADNVNDLKEPAIYSRYIEAVTITGDSSMGNHFGLFIVTNTSSAERVGQYILMPNSGRVATRYDNGGTWTAWQILATKADVDALNNNLKIIYGTSYESVVAATDDLRSLDVGTYRINGPLPTGTPALSGNWYGYVTIQNRITTAYRYYELAIGNGSYTNFRKYYGWSQGNNEISWYGV